MFLGFGDQLQLGGGGLVDFDFFARGCRRVDYPFFAHFDLHHFFAVAGGSGVAQVLEGERLFPR